MMYSVQFLHLSEKKLLLDSRSGIICFSIIFLERDLRAKKVEYKEQTQQREGVHQPA
jgi:hypothetical protein